MLCFTVTPRRRTELSLARQAGPQHCDATYLAGLSSPPPGTPLGRVLFLLSGFCLLPLATCPGVIYPPNARALVGLFLLTEAAHSRVPPLAMILSLLVYAPAMHETVEPRRKLTGRDARGGTSRPRHAASACQHTTDALVVPLHRHRKPSKVLACYSALRPCGAVPLALVLLTLECHDLTHRGGLLSAPSRDSSVSGSSGKSTQSGGTDTGLHVKSRISVPMRLTTQPLLTRGPFRRSHPLPQSGCCHHE